jgi:hypothetical protein
VSTPFAIQSQLHAIIRQDGQDRVSRMDRAWAAYYGHTPDPLKVKPGQPRDTVKVNKARVIVDKGVGFLFSDELEFKLPDPAQVWLDAVWTANKKMTLLHKLALNGGVCGHVFLKMQQSGAGVGGDGAVRQGSLAIEQLR